MGDGGSSAATAAAVPAAPSNFGNYIQAGSYGIQALSSLGGAFAQSQALKSSGKYQAQQFDFNAQIANLQAEDAIKRGDVAVNQERKMVTSTVGSERVDAASQGVDVNSGTLNQGQQDTRFAGAMNEITLKNNAWREAWGYKNAATQASFAGKFAEFGAQNQSENTLLTGGLNSLTYITQGASAYGGYNGRPGSTNGAGMRTAR